MSALPVAQIFPALLEHLAAQQHFIVCAPPGAGKSTALPLMLLKQAKLDGKIIMLEPRRLAARNIAQYLASQLGEKVGERVGYQMRGENRQSANTQLLVVTEGVLTRLVQADPELAGVGLIIFDEFHERSIHADLGLALSLEVQQAFNPELKLMLMSATLESDALQQLLPGALLLESEGRSFPISYSYHPIDRDWQWSERVAKVTQQALAEQTGNVLVFLPGNAEIRQVAQQLDTQLNAEVELHSLYGKLSLAEQQAAIQPPAAGKRKVVLATNIAETSLTIDGISCVVDSGLERQASYHATSGTTRLQTKMICKASAIQRAGRAGRLQAGHCYRLFSEEQLNHRPFANSPEICRSELSRLVVELQQWGASANELQWLDQPPTAHLAQAEQLLSQLALLEDGRLTARAEGLASSGLGPRSVAMLDQAQQWQNNLSQKGLLWRACELAALLDINAPLNGVEPNQAILQLQGAAKQQYKQQLTSLSQRLKLNSQAAVESYWDGLLLAQAFPDRIALKRQANSYTASAGFGLELQQDQQALAKYSAMVVVDLYWPEGRNQGRVALACELDIERLRQFQPERFSQQLHCLWSESAKRVVAEQQQRLGSLVLSSQPANQLEPELVIQAWLEQINRKGFSWLPLGDKAQAWLEKVRCAELWFGDLKLLDFSDQALVDSAEQWLNMHLQSCRSWQQLKSIDWLAALKSRLDWQQQQQIEQLVPSHYLAPSGNRAAIRYQLGQAPVVAIKLQEMFGQPQSPQLGNKIAITLELLSPGGKPLQLTQDLASFWQSAYVEVKKEMKGRYPKHPWPDDPVSAQATHKTKRQLNYSKT
ncbi:ATP-dependent helicase HrpB [Agarivorans sp. 1_MG-2023]|uniref:ATP-dependent helicase HrpB n=1 Tax=Agarivorans sp. 1_MG-2023 TaxID=3062634 RepID=UPI0026E1761E|nr:ATP-dependent helicase HrpB [Agarivorans sp. 1_MG-2023]MDO6763609.1 ATP-dependent helicase HrpB [Agarivorans sp. 1_MG-2023]